MSGKRVWFIRGSSRGFGRSLAEAVLAQGDRLIATARKPDRLVDLVTHYGNRVRAIRLDVTRNDDAQSAVALAIDSFGRIDVLVNNAGYGAIGAVREISDEDIHNVIGINLLGVICVTRAALPILLAQRSGHIIQVSSVAGRLACPGGALYCAAKFGVEGFSEALARELQPLGIRVTLIEPGCFANADCSALDQAQYCAKTVDPLRGSRLGRVSEGHTSRSKAAQAIIRTVEAAEPPLRLLLGRDAVGMVQRSDLSKLAELKQWLNLSVSADCDDDSHLDDSHLQDKLQRDDA